MAVNLKTLTEEELFYGAKTCQGCGALMACRMVMKVVGPKSCVAIPACCMAATTTVYPQSAIFVNNVVTAFPGLAATIAGMAAGGEAMGWDDDTTYVAFGGDGGTVDIGIQGLSGAAERNDNILYVCYDNEAYMNTGIQRSSATPLYADTTTTPVGTDSEGKNQNRKDLAQVIAAHNIPYVAQTTFVKNFKDIHVKSEKAIYTPGATFLNVLAPCPRGWRYEMSDILEICQLAVDTCFWPLFEVIDGEWILNYEPKKKLPIEDFLRPQGRFKHLFKPGKEHLIADIQAEVDRRWDELLKRAK